MSRTEKPTIRALTGVRFFAALHVLLLHAATPVIAGLPLLLKNLVGCGYVGVSFFFVLSGFILTYNYVDEKNGKNIDARSFWQARFARVVPVYLLGLLVWLPIFIREVMASNVGGFLPEACSVLGGTLVATLLVQAWYPPATYFLNPPGWSLSVEAFFYSLFPFLARPIRRLTSRQMLIAAALIWIASLIAPGMYLLVNPDNVGSGSAAITAFWLDGLKFNPLVRLPEFVLGMIAGRFFLMKKHIGHITPATHSIIGLLLISGILMLSSFIPYPLLHNGLLAPLYAYFIFSLASTEGPIAAILSTPLVVLLGEASYSLYLLHLPVDRWMLKGASIFGVDSGGLPYILVYTMTAILVSIVVLRIIEDPARRLIRGGALSKKSVTA